jgi:hypothetical protein
MFAEIPIIGAQDSCAATTIYGADGRSLGVSNPGPESAQTVADAPAPATDKDALLAQVAELRAKIAEVAKSAVKKNHVAPKPIAGRRYVLLAKSLASWGKVPQQQADIATILSKNFEVGIEVPETEVLARVAIEATNYPSLAKSVQDPGYLLRYYLGLDKKDGKHAGYIKRNFVQVRG